VKVVMVSTPEMATGYDRFYADEYRRLVPMLHALTGDRNRAEDLAQEALVRAHQQWRTVGGYERPGAWVRRVALNLASNSARRSGREQRALRSVDRADAAVDQSRTGDDLLWALVRRLPVQQRWCVALHYVEDLPVAEVARVLEISEGTVKTHLSRARATLAGELNRQEGDPRHA
jgi:RNA polymerase sigma-70 factor, ECF subfamily